MPWFSATISNCCTQTKCDKMGIVVVVSAFWDQIEQQIENHNRSPWYLNHYSAIIFCIFVALSLPLILFSVFCALITFGCLQQNWLWLVNVFRSCYNSILHFTRYRNFSIDFEVYLKLNSKYVAICNQVFGKVSNFLLEFFTSILVISNNNNNSLIDGNQIRCWCCCCIWCIPTVAFNTYMCVYPDIFVVNYGFVFLFVDLRFLKLCEFKSRNQHRMHTPNKNNKHTNECMVNDLLISNR